MDVLKVLTFVLVSVFGLCHGSFVDTLHKCALEDKTCHKNLIQKIINETAETGIPELNIKPYDPFELKNINATILDVITFVLIEGTAKGVKHCVIENTDLNVEHLRFSIKLTCDITIHGKYHIASSSPVITSFLGGKDLHGDGNGKVKVYKISISIEFPIEVLKRGDDIFFTSDLKKYKYTYNIKDKVVFHADNIYLGEKESSKDVVKLLNENWKAIFDAVGKHFVDLAMKIMNKVLLRFFDRVSVDKYLTGDLSALV